MDGKTTFAALRNEREEDLAFFERYLTEQYAKKPVHHRSGWLRPALR
jgi:hypothetical protein